MPKGNGDNANVLVAFGAVPGQEHGECRKAMETAKSCRGRVVSSGQEHGECRKAMET